MGIIYNTAALLAKAKRDNVCFDTILTIGHQTLYLSQKQIEQLAAHCGRKVDPSVFSEKEYADKFFKMVFEAKSVTSLDYSDYEDCDIIHDMNYPIDPRHHEKFDVVIDGGALEHVFNFPVAIANCMTMVKKGGSLFIHAVANNHTGHGFYQFSPELFFRIFQPENGFAVREVMLERHPFPGAEMSPRTECFSVIDPALVKQRVGLVTKSPVVITVHAIRTDIKPVFAHYPMQSDYTSLYDGNVAPASARTGHTSIYGLLKRCARKSLKLLPLRCQDFVNGQRLLSRYSFSNRQFYKRWHPF